MTVRVLLFASYADAFGTDSVEVVVPEDAKVADVLQAVRASAPSDRLPPHPMMAVNAEYAELEQSVADGDEVAIIPPVAGG
ncbi:MAG: MoaD/ThiS family protein [Gemmatimonadota bacterium]